jgi:hypothetical protein
MLPDKNIDIFFFSKRKDNTTFIIRFLTPDFCVRSNHLYPPIISLPTDLAAPCVGLLHQTMI